MCRVTNRACSRRAEPDFSKPTAMFLYLSLLVTTLCICESLTSIEIFDVFDDTLDLERPVIDTIRKPEVTVTELGEAEGSFNPSGSEEADSDFDPDVGESAGGAARKRKSSGRRRSSGKPGKRGKRGRGKPAKTCVDNTSCTEISNYTDKHINRNVTKNEYTAATVNNTNVIFNNETAHQNGDHLNQLNSSTFEALNRTSPYRVKASLMDKEPLMNVTLPALNITSAPFSCPEEEQPTNIGPYEVPTQRDVMLHIRNHLLAMYHGFHAKAMHLLKDVKEATRASWSRKMFCRGPTELMHYRRCVRWVGDLSVVTTKSLVTALETARHHINTLLQGKICNMTALSVDPIHLIRILAAEKVSLEFALPDFLRQLNDCARHCPSTDPQDYLRTSHLTDKDFVIRHYLTQQNFNQQLKQQYKI